MRDDLDHYIDAVEHLPTAPVVMVKLIALFREPECDLDEVVNLLSVDPALTAEVLRLCNSAHFGADEAVVDVFDAVMRLGFYEVYRRALAMFSLKTMSAGTAGDSISVDQLWRHSAATAVLSGMIAKQTGDSEGAAYTAGLLHDIGKLVLASAEGPKYGALIRQSGGFGRGLEAVEKAEFGFAHGAVGARLLARWGVPLDISTPVSLHHDQGWPEPFARMSAIVSLGNIAAHRLDQGAGEQPQDLPDATPAVQALQIPIDQLADLVQRAEEEVAKLEGLFPVATAK
jgi:putative nucleotidyltransferase with HDIG domain